MNKFLTYSSVFALVLLLGNCSSWSKNKSGRYQDSNVIAILETPQGLTREGLGQRYPVPDNSASNLRYKPSKQQASVPRPASNVSNTQRNQIKIQSLGEQAWVLATLPPSEVWPRVNFFLQNIGIPTINTDTQSGIIETALVQFKDDSLLHQFLIVLEQGVQLYSTELSVLQRSFVTEPRTMPSSWPRTSNSSEREQWFRDALANDLASSINDSSVSLAGTSINARSKVQIIVPQSSDPYLALDFAYDRAYASVAYSLSRGGFEIQTESKAEGVLEVSFVAVAKVKKSIWQRMAFWNSSSPKPKFYVVNLRLLSDVTEVRIRDKSGRSINRQRAEQLLSVIRANLT